MTKQDFVQVLLVLQAFQTRLVGVHHLKFKVDTWVTCDDGLAALEWIIKLDDKILMSGIILQSDDYSEVQQSLSKLQKFVTENGL